MSIQAGKQKGLMKSVAAYHMQDARFQTLAFIDYYLLSRRLVWALARAAISLKGGDPAPGSPRATLLRLHPSH